MSKFNIKKQNFKQKLLFLKYLFTGFMINFFQVFGSIFIRVLETVLDSIKNVKDTVKLL